MKKRMKVMKLLDKFSFQDTVSRVIIIGSQSGRTLYEGSLLYVPYILCTDYVLCHEEQDGKLVITTTCQSC